MDRRAFLRRSALAASFALLPVYLPASRPKKLLVLGGTGYFGPVLVKELIARGHEVTLFNRGQTNPELFPQLPLIKGDRQTEDGHGLSQLKASNQQWDWVVDTWQGSPRCVLDSVQLLAEKTHQYQYVSTLAVYLDWDTVGISEDAPLNEVIDMPTTVAPTHRYGLRKSMAEVAIMNVMGNRCALFRSHGMRGAAMIEGSHDELYWPVRIARGGDVLVPKDATFTQMTDTVSLARFMVHCGEQNLNGPYNVAYSPMQFRDYIENIVAVTNSDATLHWLPAEFLAEYDVLPYRDIPMWRSSPAGAYRFDVSRAVKAGLLNRPHQDLVRDQLAGYRARNPLDDFVFGQPDTGTISTETEERLLSIWNVRKANMG